MEPTQPVNPLPVTEDEFFEILNHCSKEQWFEICLAHQPDYPREEFDRTWNQLQTYRRIRMTPTSNAIH